ncbi:hypothetical protein [Streptomyces sp. NRRL S-1022]|uniref:hypothetical protein n=1 Tax=Streptomyces sp. NRRL S-1022 TaxID=1463880 RepID=UPI0004C25EB1|nr:hypothetical protein [Streptomyces sp. NRRL S-1022]
MTRRRDLRAGAAATAATQTPTNGSTATAASTGTALDTTQDTSPSKLRDQPFTLAHWGATLPERDVTPEEASGPLRPDELEQLAECHRAIDNARSAQWMLGRALEIVRRRRLYRGDGSRTWPQYLAAEHDGMTERDARRLQEEWRLAKAVQDALGKPAPASHVRAMLDYADSTSDEQAAHAYVMLRSAFEAAQVRLAAHQITARVAKALEPAAAEKDPENRRQAVEVRWREIHAPRPSIPAPAKAPDAALTAPKTKEAADPLAEAVTAVERALERVDNALMDESATLRRSAVDAEHLQKRLRKVGRILAKATVPADDVIDAEVVEDRAHD